MSLFLSCSKPAENQVLSSFVTIADNSDGDNKVLNQVDGNQQRILLHCGGKYL